MEIQELHDVIVAHEIMRIAEQMRQQARRTMKDQPVAALDVVEFMPIARIAYSDQRAAALSALKAQPLP